ncbi:hypothetical protein CK203_077505 [Vitis vinifera]|uniref:Reverse transcriptase zinc-binding domain-containing protein n=1 Tax=Vitis vinifera TaxID=29760 RepID=A0A438DTS8_VITVI|nr:hypothetical protein CK203_077505 [Vitis vinifera]
MDGGTEPLVRADKPALSYHRCHVEELQYLLGALNFCLACIGAGSNGNSCLNSLVLCHFYGNLWTATVDTEDTILELEDSDRREKSRVSHLQFADDTILFANSSAEELQTLKSLLLVFGQVSGLKVNLDKSNLFGINLDQNHLSRLALLLDCKALDWPILYLGLPLGGNPTACGLWDPVIERISRRLDRWQKAYLSFGGRITLVHSCLSHIPSYFLSLFKIPASVAAKVERMQRDFLWSGVGEGKEIILLVGMHCVNRGESTALWHQVILSIYETHSNGWDANTLEMGKEFAFRKICARPFSWNFNFCRNLSDSEIEDLERLMRSLDCMHLSTSASDARSWSLLSLGLFTVKSFFTALSQMSDSSPFFPTKFVWKSQVPFKVKAFVWLVAHKKVKTNDLLQLRRPHKALSPDICKLCMEQGESADHLFLHCSVSLGLWHKLFQLAKMDWVPPKSISDMMFINYKGLASPREVSATKKVKLVKHNENVLPMDSSSVWSIDKVYFKKKYRPVSKSIGAS